MYLPKDRAYPAMATPLAETSNENHAEARTKESSRISGPVRHEPTEFAGIVKNCRTSVLRSQLGRPPRCQSSFENYPDISVDLHLTDANADSDRADGSTRPSRSDSREGLFVDCSERPGLHLYVGRCGVRQPICHRGFTVDHSNPMDLWFAHQASPTQNGERRRLALTHKDGEECSVTPEQALLRGTSVGGRLFPRPRRIAG